MKLVRCKCGKIYDLYRVERTARYADCDMFITPCCQRSADTRRFKIMPDFDEVDRQLLADAKLIYNDERDPESGLSLTDGRPMKPWSELLKIETEDDRQTLGAWLDEAMEITFDDPRFAADR